MRQLVWIFLCAAPAYALAAHVYAWRLRLRLAIVLGGHAAPTFAAGAIAWNFLVGRGESLAQGWIAMWPALLILLGAGGSVHAMASLFVAADRTSRRWLPLTLGGGALCALGLAATFSLAPTA